MQVKLLDVDSVYIVPRLRGWDRWKRRMERRLGHSSEQMHFPRSRGRDVFRSSGSPPTLWGCSTKYDVCHEGAQPLHFEYLMESALNYITVFKGYGSIHSSWDWPWDNYVNWWGVSYCLWIHRWEHLSISDEDMVEYLVGRPGTGGWLNEEMAEMLGWRHCLPAMMWRAGMVLWRHGCLDDSEKRDNGDGENRDRMVSRA